jgi:uncharacterized membrane protein
MGHEATAYSAELLIGIALTLAAVIIGAWLLWREEKKRRALADLDEDEREIADFLLRNGPSPQQALAKHTGWNPVKLNKVLRRLEELAIAKRVPHGRENTVELVV